VGLGEVVIRDGAIVGIVVIVCGACVVVIIVGLLLNGTTGADVIVVVGVVVVVVVGEGAVNLSPTSFSRGSSVCREDEEDKDKEEENDDTLKIFSFRNVVVVVCTFCISFISCDVLVPFLVLI